MPEADGAKIIRVWRTEVDPERIDEYIAFTQSESLPMFRSQAGFLGVFFAHGGTEHVAINRRHPVHAPVVGVRLDQVVDVRATVLRNAKYIFREALHFTLDVTTTLPKCFAHIIGLLFAKIGLIEHLQCKFAGFAAGAHKKAVSCQPSAFSLQEGARATSERAQDLRFLAEDEVRTLVFVLVLLLLIADG